MKAKICDRCNLLWKDDNKCEVPEIEDVRISIGNSINPKIINFDLCEFCRNGLFEYLKNNEKNATTQ